MSRDQALRAAISLVQVPSHVRAQRLAPLPKGTLLLLGVAAGDPDSEREAAQLIDRSPDLIRHAAGFFIEQILLTPGTDCYRLLGAQPTASNHELRTHMALLMRWLHPDMDPEGQRSLFAGRVIQAWDNLKTAERRSLYDASLAGIADKSRTKKTWRVKPRLHKLNSGHPSRLRRILSQLLNRSSDSTR